MPQEPKYWLVKTDYAEYQCDDFERDRVTLWEGVRNHQAKKFILSMQPGDKIFVFHSKCEHPGIYCMGEVVSKSYPDPSQFEPESIYFDPRATRSDPIWYTFDMRFTGKLAISKDIVDRTLSANRYYCRQKRLSVLPLAETEAMILLEHAGL